MTRKGGFKIGAVVFACVLQALGVGVPHLDITGLVNSADVIVIADVSASKLTGRVSNVHIQNQSFPAHEFAAALQVRRFIKGRCPEELTVQYSLPDTFVGHIRMQTGRRMLFLRREGNGYVIANPYYPDLPAAGDTGLAPQSFDDPVVAVLHELADVVASPISAQDRMLVLQKDYAIPSSDYFTSSVKRGIASAPNPQVREALQAELLMRDDLSELPKISEVLSAGTVTPEGKEYLVYAIGNRLKDPRAVPELLPLLSVRDPAVRVAVAEALWHIADPKTTAKIVRLLDDPERDVRYYATRALADITGENLWGPSIPEFEEHERQYLDHWRQWAKESGFE
jgi:hypothetical protein